MSTLIKIVLLTILAIIGSVTARDPVCDIHVAKRCWVDEGDTWCLVIGDALKEHRKKVTFADLSRGGQTVAGKYTYKNEKEAVETERRYAEACDDL